METINFEKNDHIVKVILNRPDVHNAMNAKMIEEITQAFHKISEDPTARVVYIKGMGASFSAGADLNWMKDSIQFSQQQNFEDAQKLFDMFSAVKNCKLPVIAKLHGNVMGGGLGLVAAADITYAEVGSIFSFSEVKLGLVPAVISSFVKAKMTKAGMHDLMLTGRQFDAPTALRYGLISGSGRELEINEIIKQRLESFAKLAPEAVVQTKKLLLALDDMPASKYRDHTSELIAEKRASTEGQEGLNAFFEKRKPNWVLNISEYNKEKV